jgi:hypothetical protein
MSSVNDLIVITRTVDSLWLYTISSGGEENKRKAYRIQLALVA